MAERADGPAEAEPQPAPRSPAAEPPGGTGGEPRAVETGPADAAAAERMPDRETPQQVDRETEGSEAGLAAGSAAGGADGPGPALSVAAPGTADAATPRGAGTSAAPERDRRAEPLPRGTGAAARDDVLPDVDRIGSTLRPETERTRSARNPDGTIAPHRLMPVPYMSPAEAARAAERRSFRWGFVLVLGVTFALIALYLGGPGLARAIPSIEPELAIYVDAVNAFRATLNGWLDDAVRAVGGMAAG